MRESQSLITNIEEKQVIIQADNLGVSFTLSHRKDDYKSRVYNLLMRKRNSDKSKPFWPLRNLNFVGYKGEVLGVVGSNGSGKTTLCKLIAGILQPDEGRLRIKGNVSALFAYGLGFNKELTGRENVYVSGMMLGINKYKITSFINEIHEFSGIGSFIDHPIKYYSSGMKARLGFSVAAFLDPEILILDEALNTGDLEFSQKAGEKIKELSAKAKMVILVTHSLAYAEKNCDRLIWLDKGTIKCEGTPSKVIQEYTDTSPMKNKETKKIEIQKINIIKKGRVVVKAENMSVSYQLGNKAFWALKDINFCIKEGEVVGIIGQNGAGKSTLCKVLTKILKPDKGNIEINGDTTALLGYGTGFNDQLTGKDNVFLNGMLLGIPKERISKSFSDIVNFSELENFIDRPVKQYSSGMKSRLGFSVTAFLQPDIFIIDEALSTGDMSFNQKASEKIHEMIEQSKAVIIVSHSMSFVEKVCSRVIWLKDGKIYFDGNPKEVVAEYKVEQIGKKNT